MNFLQAVKSGFRNYATCSSRSSRSEFWYWTLFTLLVDVPLIVLDKVIFHMNNGPLDTIFALATFLPSFCVMIRRLHDVDRSGYWWLISLTIIGLIPLFIWYCTKGTAGENRFGADPLAKNLS